MIITDAILRANSKHAIYFLLTSYIEAVGYDVGKQLPEHVAKLPLAGLKDLTARYSVIVAKLEEPIATGSGTAAALKEAAEVFRSALLRLCTLASQWHDRCERHGEASGPYPPGDPATHARREATAEEAASATS